MAILCIFGATFFIVWSIKIHIYERPSKIDTLREESRDKVSDDKFYTHRIIDLLTAMERNETVNDRRAEKLKISLYLMLVGYSISVFFIFMILL